MTEIIPAIIPEQFSDLEEHLGWVVGLAKTVQIDVLDGRYIPSRSSWPYKKNDEHFKKILDEAEGMPFWDKFNFEIHMMVKEPENKIEEWLRAGAESVVIHPESTHKLPNIIDTYTGALNISIAISAETHVEPITSELAKVKHIQLMGIKNVGYQGEAFDHKTIARLKALREEYPEHVISIDGGVTLENASELLAAGANRLVVGSALFESENINETMRLFKQVSN